MAVGVALASGKAIERRVPVAGSWRTTAGGFVTRMANRSSVREYVTASVS